MIWNKINYSQDLSLLRSCIYEYDIEKANISMLRQYGLLSQNEYDRLYKSDKKVREISIGLLIRDENEEKKEQDRIIYKTIQNGIKEAKRVLFETCNIDDKEVLSIRNDAVFITRQLPDVIQVNDFVRFTKRNEYNLFVKVFRLHLFYYYNQVTKQELLHIKGLSNKEEHEEYMIDFLKELFCAYQTRSIESVMILLNTFYFNYCNGTLPKQFYRNLSDGLYTLKHLNNSPIQFSADILSDNLLEDIDISDNAAFLRELYKIFSVEYLRNK